jgi:TolB-like protein/lipoprotein NlpI
MPGQQRGLTRFWQELKRRKVVRVITVYAAAAFVILELLSIIIEPLRLPEWTLQFAIVFLCIGFIIAIILSWIYDIHPEGGIVKTEPVDKVKNDEKPTSSNTWKVASYISFVVIVALIVLNIIPRTGNNGIIDKSIAVLPFRNDSPDESKMYFINGTMEAILDNLSKIEDLRVPGRTSVEQYRNNPPPIPTVSEELDVSYILEGSGHRDGNNVRLVVQLLDGKMDKRLWSKTYDADIEEIFSMQSEIAQLVAAEIEAIITPEEKQLIEKLPTSDLTAYDYYLQGKEFYYIWWKTFNNSNLNHAELLFDNAVKRDSTFALAYAGKAAVFARYARDQSNVEKNYPDSVRIYCDKAISLDPDAAFAYVIRGLYYTGINKIKEGESDLKKAVELNPNDPFILRGLAILYYNNTGDYLAAIKLLKRAEKVGRDPGHRYATYARMSHVYKNIGDWEKVDFYKKKSREMNPLVYLDISDYIVQGKFQNAIEILETRPNKNLSDIGVCYLMQGEYDSALDYLKKVEEERKENNPDNYNPNAAGYRYGQVLLGIGRRDEGLGIINYWLQRNENIIDLGREGSHRALFDNAGLLSFLGETEKAIEYLQKYNNTSCWSDGTFYLMLVDPLFDNIRKSPEYEEIINNVQAENAKIRAKIARL